MKPAQVKYAEAVNIVLWHYKRQPGHLPLAQYIRRGGHPHYIDTMSGHPTQRILFERFVIRAAATGEMAGMHGLTGTVNNIFFEPEDNKYRYVLCLDYKQDTPSTTRDVANFYAHSADGFCTALCGFVFPREKPAPPESGRCLVCTKASRHTYAFQMEGKCPLLPYCSPACLSNDSAAFFFIFSENSRDLGEFKCTFPLGESKFYFENLTFKGTAVLQIAAVIRPVQDSQITDSLLPKRY